MKKYISLLILLFSSFAWGAPTNNPNTSKYKGQSLSESFVSVHFGDLDTLPAQYNGTIGYCDTCQQGPVCIGGGTGAWYIGIGGLWNCNIGTAGTTVAGIPGVIYIPAAYGNNTDHTTDIQNIIDAGCAGGGVHPEFYFPFTGQNYRNDLGPLHFGCGSFALDGPQQGSLVKIVHNYVGPTAYIQTKNQAHLEYAAPVVGSTGNSLNLKSYVYDSLGATSYNDVLNGSLQTINGLGDFNIHYAFTCSSITGGGGFHQPIFASSRTNASIANGSSDQAFYTEIKNTSTYNASLNFTSTGLVNFDDFTPSIGTKYEVELNRSGTSCQEFIGPVGGSITQNGATKTCTGTLLVDPYEVISVPSMDVANWPWGGNNTNPAWCNIDAIKISNVSVHTGTYTSNNVKPTADVHTLLLDNFITPTGQQIDSEPVYLGNTTAPNGFFPVRLSAGVTQVSFVHVSYLDFTSGLYISDVFQSKFNDNFVSANTGTGIELAHNDFESKVSDNSIFGGTLCINYGNGYSEGTGHNGGNSCNQSGSALHTCYNATSASFKDESSQCQDQNSPGDLIFPWIEIASHIDYSAPFNDEEGTGNSLKAAFGFIKSNFGPDHISLSESNTKHSKPFVIQSGGAGLKIEGLAWGTQASDEVIDITTAPTGMDFIDNSAIAAIPSSNLPQYVKVNGISKVTFAQLNTLTCPTVGLTDDGVAGWLVTNAITCTTGSLVDAGGAIYCTALCKGATGWVH